MRTGSLVLCAALVLAPPSGSTAAPELRVDPGPAWKPVGTFAGRSYYTIVEEAGVPLIHARYEPGRKTVILGQRLEVPAGLSRLSWRWRVGRFPVGADERVEGRIDSAAAVYVTYATFWRRYVIKYVWSTTYPRGSHWVAPDSRPLEQLHVVVLEGPPPVTDTWREETVSPADEFRRYFAGERDDVPPVVALGLLSDGDGTRSLVEADYAGFRFHP